MKIGYSGLNIGAFNHPDSITRLLKTAEDSGFESIWTGEHVVLVDPQKAPSPVPPHTNFVDTIASLAFAAAKTERLKIGSGIILLAQRDPIVLAKELAGIDILSKGRLLFGVGVGYVEGEFEALGIPYAERGARVSEHIDVIRELWTSDSPSFSGRFSSFSGIQSRPQPAQTPSPPILIGGTSPPALRRAVSQGDGWFGFFLDPDAAAKSLRSLEEASEQIGRPASLGRLEITVTPPGPVDADMVRHYEDLGVDRLVLTSSFIDIAGPGVAKAENRTIKFLEETAEALGLSN